MKARVLKPGRLFLPALTVQLSRKIEIKSDLGVTDPRRRLSSLTDATSVVPTCEQIYFSVTRSDSKGKTNGYETLEDGRGGTLRY
jgi:hypothetical protein